MNNIQRNRFGNQLDGRGLREVDLNLITIAQSITRLHHVLVHQNVAVCDCALSSSAAYCCELGSQE